MPIDERVQGARDILLPITADLALVLKDFSSLGKDNIDLPGETQTPKDSFALWLKRTKIERLELANPHVRDWKALWRKTFKYTRTRWGDDAAYTALTELMVV